MEKVCASCRRKPNLFVLYYHATRRTVRCSLVVQHEIKLYNSHRSGRYLSVGRQKCIITAYRQPPGAGSDRVTIVCIVIVGLGVLFLGELLRVIRKLARKQRIRVSLKGKWLLFLIAHVLVIAASMIITFLIPQLLLGGLPWSFIIVWTPATIPSFLNIFLAVCATYLMLVCLLAFTKKTKES